MANFTHVTDPAWVSRQGANSAGAVAGGEVRNGSKCEEWCPSHHVHLAVDSGTADWAPVPARLSRLQALGTDRHQAWPVGPEQRRAHALLGIDRLDGGDIGCELIEIEGGDLRLAGG